VSESGIFSIPPIDVLEDENLPPDRTLILGQFKDQEVEQIFRHEQLANEIRQLMFLAWIVLPIATLFVASDISFGEDRFTISVVFVVRSIWFCASFSMLLMVRRLRTARQVHRLAMAYVMLTILVIVLYPIPLGHRVSIAAVFTVSALVLLYFHKEPTDGISRGSITLSFLIGNVIGFVAARWNGVTQRLIFSNVKKKHDMAVHLDKAVKMADELSLLLPIFGTCKKVRGDDGYWHQIDEFMTLHSDAIFSHGLCVNCVEKL